MLHHGTQISREQTHDRSKGKPHRFTIRTDLGRTSTEAVHMDCAPRNCP